MAKNFNGKMVKFLKYVCPFYNITHERVKPLLRKPKNYTRKRRRSNKTIEEIPHNISTLFPSYTRRQILPAPPSKLPSPQKILHDNNKSQSDPKHLQSVLWFSDVFRGYRNVTLD